MTDEKTQENKIQELKEKIKKCDEYKLIKARCDVLNWEGKRCGEVVKPMIAFDASATSEDDFQWKYQGSYHVAWSCPKHGCVPIKVGNKYYSSDSVLDLIGEFKQVLQAELKGRQETLAHISEEIEKLPLTIFSCVRKDEVLAIIKSEQEKT